MNRRGFLRSAAVIAAGVVTADQMEIVERLGWKRRLFAGWSRPVLYGDGVTNDAPALQALFEGREVWDVRHREVLRRTDGLVQLPNGSFRTSTTLRLPSNVSLHGSGESWITYHDMPKDGYCIMLNGPGHIERLGVEIPHVPLGARHALTAFITA